MKPVRTWQILISLFLLAAGIRLVYFYQVRATPFFGFLSADPTIYHRFAFQILQGQLAVKETALFYPLYPFFLALIYACVGKTLASVLFAQILIDAATCVFLYLLCVEVFSSKGMGVAASLIYAFYGLAIFYSSFLLGTTLLTFLTIATLTSLVWAHKGNRRILWLCAGLFAGLSMLLKATMLLFLFFFFIWYAVWLNTHRHQIKGVFTSLLLLCLGVCAVLLPFAARNYAIDKRFSPFPIQGGLNFYRGNNPHATGTIMEIFSSMRAPIQEAREAAFWARRDAGKPLSDAEVSRYWAAKGASFIREQPWQYTQLLARKFLYFWNARESYASANYEFCQKYVPFLNLPFFSFGTITPFAIIGLFFALRGRSPYLMLIVLFVIASMISLMIFYVTARFRFPVVPYIIMLALHGARRIIAVLRKPDSQRQAYLYSLLMAAALFLSYNTVVSRTNQSENTMSYVNLGNSHARRGMYADARNAFRKALALNPRLARVHCMIGRTYFDERMFDTAVAEYAQALVIDPDSALAHVLMGEACHAQGLLDEAIAAYEKSLALDPDSAAAHADLGDAYLAGGRLRMAASEYEKAVDLDPAFLRKYYEIGNVFNSRGMTNEAIVFYQRYLEKEPRSPGVYTNLGNAYAKRGEMERAIQEYKRAIRLDPRWAEAHCSLGWVYYIIKMPDEALLELLIALETAPDAAIVHRNLAEVYRSLGDDEKATYHAKQERLLAEEQKVK